MTSQSIQWVKFGDLGTVTQGLSVSRYKDEKGNPEFVVNVKDLGNLYISGQPAQTRLDEKANVERYRLQENDVIIGIRGTLLNSSVVTSRWKGSLPGSNVAVFRSNGFGQITPLYVAALMRSAWFKEFVALQKRSSTTLPSIRISDLRKFEIPLPVIDMQTKISQLAFLFESYETSALSALKARKELVEMSFSELLGK